MAPARLYVRSNRTTLITSRVGMETMGYDHSVVQYSEGSILVRFSRDEEYAMEVLKRSGVDFEIVDLSKGIRTKLQGRVKGITETPTFSDGSESQRRYVGLREIQKFVADKKPSP